MKKLLFAFAAAASFAALAADPTPGANDIDVLGFEGFNLADPTVTGAVVNRTDTGIEGTSKWSCSGDDASLVKTYGNDNAAKGSGLSYPAPFEDEGDNYLALDTNGSELQRTIPAANQAVAADGTYIDTLVQFTPSESAPTSADLTGAKLAIWLGVENNVTNLYVQGASYTQPTAGDPSTFSFQDAVAYKLSGTYQPGTWYRLTVKAVQSLIDGMPGYYLPGFIIMIDGDELTTDVNAYDANAYSFLTTAQDMGGTPITLVSATNKKLLDDKVFVPALGVAAMTDAPTLTAVGFKGTGALDDFVVTTAAPDFTPAAADFILTIDGSDVVIHPTSEDLAAFEALGIDTSDVAAANTALNTAITGTDIPAWQALFLGLAPTAAGLEAFKIDSIAFNEDGEVVVTVPAAIDLKTGRGVDITLNVFGSDDLSTWSSTPLATATNTKTIPGIAPAANETKKFYKVSVGFAESTPAQE